jgi:hypothetical protein
MRRTVHAAALAALALVAGCGGAPPQAKLAEVEGIVTLDTKPLSGVIVFFTPDLARDTDIASKESLKKPRPTSSAVTDADGRFKLLCSDGRPGAMVGWHNVTFTDPEQTNVSQEESLKNPRAGNGRVPVRYQPRGGSAAILKIEVKEGQKNEVPLVLTTRGN